MESHRLSSAIEALSVLGDQVQSIDLVMQTGERSWAIEFEDEAVVLVELAEQDPLLLTFTALLGTPAERHRLAICETLMSWNTLAVDDGGATFGMGGSGGQIVLMQPWRPAAIEAVALAEELKRFDKLARRWRAYVGGEADPEAEAEAAAAAQRFSVSRALA
jgi:hypothetical protein